MPGSHSNYPEFNLSWNKHQLFLLKLLVDSVMSPGLTPTDLVNRTQINITVKE